MPNPNDNLFVCVSQFRKPDEVQVHLPEHLKWLDDQDNQGRIVATGAQVPLGAGGVQILTASSRHEMDEILSTDPFVIHGVSAYWVFEFQLNPEPDQGRLMKYFFSSDFASNDS